MTVRLFSRTIIAAAVCAAALASCRPAAPRRLSGITVPVSDSIIAAGGVDTIRLGRMRAGETVVKQLVVTNRGDKPFLVSGVNSECGCIVSAFDREPVLPGGESPVEVSFDSRGYAGYVIRRVTVTTTLSPEPLVLCVEAEIE